MPPMRPPSPIDAQTGAATGGPDQGPRLRVENLTRGTTLATFLEVADTPRRRSKGLLGRKGLEPGGGLWIAPCESVHTFFMQFPIDLVYLDRNKRVRKVCAAVPAWRLSACLSAHSILELPAGQIVATRTSAGDLLAFSPADSPSPTLCAAADAEVEEPGT
jgi:uncharacterized membrane protein (UPF0127 family)